jgi:integrase
MVELQRLTGMRPGETCMIRRCDIDTGGSVWLYKPQHHKTAWRGKSRVIAIGPKGQAVLKQFFVADINAYLFRPRRAVEELLAARSTNRKTPRYPSHVKYNAKRRKGTERKRPPAECYNHRSYARAVARAFPHPADLSQDERKAWEREHHWRPNQLRHSFATKVRRAHGLEAAGAALGHTRMSATECYAERDAQLAEVVAAKLG